MPGFMNSSRLSKIEIYSEPVNINITFSLPHISAKNSNTLAGIRKPLHHERDSNHNRSLRPAIEEPNNCGSNGRILFPVNDQPYLLRWKSIAWNRGHQKPESSKNYSQHVHYIFGCFRLLNVIVGNSVFSSLSHHRKMAVQ